MHAVCPSPPPPPWQVLARLQQRLSREELRRRAADLFNAGQYDKALPIFQRLRKQLDGPP